MFQLKVSDYDSLGLVYHFIRSSFIRFKRKENIMKTEIKISTIYWNGSLCDYFFREQSKRTFEELVSRAKDGDSFLSRLDDITDGMDLDEVEEMFYQDSVEEIARELEIEDLIEEENDDDE